MIICKYAIHNSKYIYIFVNAWLMPHNRNMCWIYDLNLHVCN